MAKFWPAGTVNDSSLRIFWPWTYSKQILSNDISAFWAPMFRAGELGMVDMFDLTVISWNMTCGWMSLRIFFAYPCPYLHVYQSLSNLPVHGPKEPQGNRELKQKSIHHHLTINNTTLTIFLTLFTKFPTVIVPARISLEAIIMIAERAALRIWV